MHSYLIGLLFTLLILSGCNNPSGDSVVSRGHTPLLETPSSFQFTQVLAKDGNALLRWSSSKRAEQYKVYQGLSNTSVDTPVPSCTGTSTICLISGLNTNTTYYFKVEAQNAAGATAVNANAPVLSVTSFNITSSVVSDKAVTLTWVNSNNATQYNVFYGFSSGSYPNKILNVTSPYTVTNLTNNRIHYFKVVATNTKNGYGESEEASATPIGAPIAPGGLSISTGPGSVTLNWNSVAGATNYKIFRGTTSGALEQLETSASPGYTDTSITNGTVYYYHVRANNDVYDSAPSAEVSIQPIENFSITSVSSGGTPSQLVVTWPSVAGATSFNIRYGTNSGSLSTVVNGVTSPFTLSGLTGGTTYYFKITAVNSTGAGNTEESNIASGTPVALVPAPGGLTATATPGTVHLNWSSVSGASSYEVLRGTSSGVYASLQSGIVGTSYSDSTASAGTSYFYVVRSFNGLTSPNSTEVSVKPISAVSISSSSVLSSTSIQLSWSGGTGADAFDLRYGTSPGNYTSTVTGVTAPHTLTGLTPNTTYYFTVRGRNAVGLGTVTQSGESSAQTKTSAPTSLIASTSPGQISLDWANTTGAASYTVYRGTSSGTYTSLASGVLTSSYVDTTVTDGTTYFYVVSATNSTESAYSSEVQARSISSFSIATTSDPTTSSITVSWPSTDGASSYDIRYGTSPGNYSVTLTNRTSPATITSLSSGTNYYIIVVAKNAIGSGSSVSTAEVIQRTPVNAPTGVAATAGNGQISVSWTAVAGASSYKVYRGTTSGTYSLLESNVTGTSYIDSTTIDGTIYYYVVKSFNGSDSVDSSEVSGKTIASWLLTSATVQSSTSIEIIFPATEGGDLYDIRWGTTSGTYTGLASGVTSPYTITGLAANTTYYIVGRARNTVGSGANRQTSEFSAKTSTASPSSLAAVSSPSAVALSWTATAGATSYKVYRGTNSGSHSELATGVMTNSHTDSTVVNGTTYYYVVRAFNGTDSASSNEVVTRPIENFSIASLTSPTSTTLEVSWASVAGAAEYDVRWGTSTGSYTSQSLNVTSPFTITGLSANTNYFVVVRAKNSIGAGTTRTSAEATRRTATAAPSSLVASASPGQVGLNWSLVTGATSYSIYRGTTSLSYSEIATGVTTAAYMDTTVDNGTTYYYAVKASNGSESGFSNEVAVRPIGPFNLTAVAAASSTALNLSWESANGATSYDVRYGTTSGVYLGTLTNVTSPYTLTGLTANTQYFISIRANNSVGSGTSVSSNEMNARTGTVAPTSLAATTTSGQIVLAWTAASGATNYRIYRGTATGTYSQLASGVTGTTYTDTTVANGTQYYYVVRAFNGIESANSNEATGLPLPAFTITSTEALSTSTIRVNWASVTGASSYEVRYGTASGTYTSTITGATSPYTINSLSTGTTYYIVVRALNAVGSGTSTQSTEVSQVTSLLAPTGLAASATPGSVSLSWNVRAGASSYKVYRGTTSGSLSELATGITNNSYIDSSVANGTTYFYAVSAFNGSDSLNSSEVSIRPIASFTITSAVPTSSSQIAVTWPVVSGAALYDLRYGTTSGSYTTTLTNQTSPVTISGLTPGSSYYFVVVAKNSIGSGTSFQSPEIGASTAFGAPTGLAVSATQGQVNLTWNSVSGATSYKVFRGTTSGSYTEIESNAVTNSYTDTSVVNGTTYYYTVKAYNGVDSADSNEASVRPIANFTFNSVTATSSTTLDLTWSTATGAATYDVRYGTVSGNLTTTISNVTSPYTLSGLTAGTIYYVSIRGRNAVGSGTSLDSAELNTRTSPLAPTSLVATATTGQISLSWVASGSAASYNIYRGTTSGTYSSLATGVSTLTYSDTTVSNGTQYYYVVRANNGTESVNSSEATALPIPSFTISSTSALSPNSIEVSWPLVNGATAYDVRYGTSTGSYSTTLTNVTSPYTITGLTGATNYYIVVRAKNTVGPGTSTQSSEAIQVTPLGAPTGLVASATPGSVNLSWSAVAGSSSYKIFRGTSSGSYAQLAAGVTGTSYTDSTVANGTSYFYVVRSYNGADSAASNEASIRPMANFSITGATSLSSTSIQVAWTGPTGAATFDVRYGTATGSYTTTLTNVTSPFTITGLSAGTNYFIVVRANNTVGAGASVTSSETSALTALSAPAGLTASGSPGSVGLNWTSQAAATSYKVYRGTTSGSLTLLNGSVSSNAYMDTTVANGTTYYYAVLSNNGSDSALSSEVAVRPISSFSLTAATPASATSINLSWESATGAATYDLRYGTATGVYLGTVTNVTSPYSLTSLTAGTTYFISIQAKNAVGLGTIVNSNEMNAKTATGAPTGLAAVSSTGNVSLTWNAVSGATNYNVYRSTTTTGPYTQIASAVTAAAYSDSTVANGTTYFYVVRSFNGYESDNSSEVSVRPIASFTLASATVSSTSAASISWDPAAGAATYDVRIGTSSGNYTTTYTNVTSPYSLSGLTAATTYFVRIRANNTVGSGSSTTSNEVSFTTTTAAPSTLTASAATGQVSLSWTAVTGAASYRVYRSTTSGTGYTQIASGVAVTNYSDTTVTNGTQYYYVVRAFNGTESANSTEATSLPIDAFTISSTSAASSTSIVVTWGSASGASAYDVRYGTTAGTYATTASGVTSPYTITGLAANTTYYIIVRARNTIGSGTSANTPEVTQITSVAAPTGLAASGGSGQVNLSWTATTGASSYKIFRGTTSGSLTQIASGITGTTYSDTTAVNGTTYFYAIRAFNGSDSALSSEVSSRPISSFAISGITGLNTTSLQVSWAAATGAASYDLRYGLVSGTYTTTLTNVTSPHTITGLSAGTTYFIQVVAKNAVGSGTTVNSAQSSGSTNSAPVISAISDQTADAGVAKAVPFTLTDSNDLLTCSGSMSGTSSNTTIIPNANIVFSGTMPDCIATITPAAGQSGTAAITLTASDGKDTASRSFNVTVSNCAVANITWETQPGNINAGSNWATAPRVALRRADNTICATSTAVSLSVVTDNSIQQDATVSGTFTVNAVNGYASFPAATMTRAGTGYQIVASTELASTALSSTFTVNALAASKWAWSAEPLTSNRLSTMVPNPTIRAADMYGNYVTYSTAATISIFLEDNTEGATLSGTTSRTHDGTGTVVFNNLSINNPGSYYLSGTASNGWAVDNSEFFSILNITPVNTVTVLEMLTGALVHSGQNTSYPGAAISFGTNHINGTTTYTWRIVATNTATNADATIRLRLGTTSIVDIPVPRNTSTPTAFTATIPNINIGTDGNWSLRIERGTTVIYSSQIVVHQTDATKAMAFIPLTSTENNTASTSSIAVTGNTNSIPNAQYLPIYNWDGAKINRIDSAALYVTSRGGTCVTLWNNSTGSAIGNEVCNSSTTDSIAQVALPVASLPTGTAELQLRMRTTGTTGYVTKAGILLRLVSVQNMIAIQRTAPAVSALTASTDFTANRIRSYRNGYGTADVSEYVVCRARANTAGTGNFVLRDHGTNASGSTGATDISASTNSYSTQSSFTTLEQGPVSTTNGNSMFARYNHTSGSFALSQCTLETESAYP